MTCRERRCWTEQEDELLREAVRKEDPDTHPPSKWHQIAKHVPNRTNKDCRKRWFAKFAAVVAKGGWSADEDERLIKAVEVYGTKWSLVASAVITRNNDQCAKRWSDTLNPSIDRTTWSPEEDAQLLQAVQIIGKSWTKIVKTYFPGRTGLSAKNRYCRLIRIMSDTSRGPRTRRRSATIGAQPYKGRRRSTTSTSLGSDTSSNHRTSPDSPYSLFFPEYSDMSNFTGLPSSTIGVEGFSSGEESNAHTWPAEFFIPPYSGKGGIQSDGINAQISMGDLTAFSPDFQPSSTQRSSFEAIAANSTASAFLPSSVPGQVTGRFHGFSSPQQAFTSTGDPRGLGTGSWASQPCHSRPNNSASAFDMDLLHNGLTQPISSACRMQNALSSPQSQSSPHPQFHISSPSRSSVTSAPASPPMQKPYDQFPSQHALPATNFDAASDFAAAAASFSETAGSFGRRNINHGVSIPASSCAGYDATSMTAYQWFVGKFEESGAS